MGNYNKSDFCVCVCVCVFGTVDMSFQIITAFVCYRHEILQIIISVSFSFLLALEQGNFFFYFPS
jgi:hypothetical protein